MARRTSAGAAGPARPAAVQMTALLDWYGELLTDRQRQIFHLYYDEDMSLGEIGQELGISRQAVHDQLHRGGVELARYERLLGLAGRAAAYQEWRQRYHAQLTGLPGLATLDRLFEPGALDASVDTTS